MARQASPNRFIKANIKMYLELSGMNSIELAKRTGMAVGTVSNRFNGKGGGWRYEELDRVARALGCGVRDLIP